MKYLFVLGRNPLLSEAEILSCFERDGIKKLGHKMRANALLVEVDKELDLKRMISELGGTVAIGRVLLSGKRKEIIEKIAKEIIYFGRENKVVYSVLDFTENDEDFAHVLDAVKENLKNERLKARYKGVSGTIKLQGGKIARGSPEKIMLRDMNYFAFSRDGELNFGFLEASYDSSESEKKDMEKPYRRESLAISPRLARILVNLSQVKEKETLLDPFCGIGVIAAEALLRGINAIGVDIDSGAVGNARKNIAWMRQNYRIDAKDKIITEDSRRIALREEISGIAAEPSLGELMTRIPQRDKALEIIGNFERLVIDVLKNVKKNVKKGGKIAFTAPLIKLQGKSGRIGCDFERISMEAGLRLYKIENSCIAFPLKEYRDEQIVGREICVLSN